jgi:type III pantothenate kinase
MLLAINANNTNVKFALCEGDAAIGDWRISTDIKRTADEYAVWLTQLMALKGHTPDSVKAAIIATVVPQALYELKLLCRKYFGCEPLVVGDDGIDLGIGIRIDRPDEAGADRLLNAVAGHRQYGGPLIVVDFGTATSFDIVSEEGDFVGGIIAPGINLSVDALYAAAAKLPRVAVEKPARVIGKSTIEAVRSGVYWGYVGLIEGIIARVRQEYGRTDMKVVVTGGLAPLFADSTDIFDHVDPELTMKGLIEVHRRNTDK